MRKSVLLVFTVTALIGCTNVSQDDLINIIEPPILVTYNADIKMIIDNNCFNYCSGKLFVVLK